MLIDVDEVNTREHLVSLIKFISTRIGISKNNLQEAINKYWGPDNYLKTPSSIPLTDQQKYGKTSRD